MVLEEGCPSNWIVTSSSRNMKVSNDLEQAVIKYLLFYKTTICVITSGNRGEGGGGGVLL